MQISFDYEYLGQSPQFGKIYRPKAKVIFTSTKTSTFVLTWMVVDSGADHTILPLRLADDLEINLKTDCEQSVSQGLGGKKQIHLLKKPITAILGGVSLKVPIAIVEDNNIPPLMGRAGFLELFDVTLSKEHKIIFNF